MSNIFFAELIQQLVNNRATLRILIQALLSLDGELENKINHLLSFYDHMNDMSNYIKDRVTASATAVITLNVRGSMFEVETEHLNAYPFFQALLFSDPAPSRGHYFIDRPFEGIDRIVNAVRGEELSYEGLNDYEAQCIDANLKYFRLPFPIFKRVYTTSYSWSAGYHVWKMYALQDGRLCTYSNDDKVKVWNTSSYECELELLGHTHIVLAIIHLTDGRICTGSVDRTIKLWNLTSRECESTLFQP
jgi:hypothetical protein